MSTKLFEDHELIDATEQLPPPFEDIDLEPLPPRRAAEGTRENVAAPNPDALRSVVVADELRTGWDFEGDQTPLPAPHVDESFEVELESNPDASDTMSMPRTEPEASDTAPSMAASARPVFAMSASDSVPSMVVAEGTRNNALPKLPPLPPLPPPPTPALPIVPPRPAAPVVPLAPAVPVVPALPVVPAAPLVPAVPVVSTEPPLPAAPVVPAPPLVPASPVLPATPVVPDEPPVPVELPPPPQAASQQAANHSPAPRKQRPRRIVRGIFASSSPLGNIFNSHVFGTRFLHSTAG